MTRQEVQDLLAMVQAAYPNYNPPSKTAAVNVWAMALADYDKNQVAMAFKVYLTTNTSGFAPSIGQLIDQIHLVSTPQELNEQEAWALVRKAISNSGYNSNERFKELPIAAQRAVGTPSQLKMWAMDEQFNENVVSSNFMRVYRQELQKAEALSKMPPEIKKLVEKANVGSDREKIELDNAQAISAASGKEKLIEINRTEEQTDISEKINNLRRKINKQ